MRYYIILICAALISLGDVIADPFDTKSNESLLTASSFMDFPVVDSTEDDSTMLEFSSDGFLFGQEKQLYKFLFTDKPDDRISRDIEPFTIIDFNRAVGFFLGIGSSSYRNFGRYNELGVKGGIGFGFAKQKAQSMLGGEYRIPLKAIKTDSADELDRWVFVQVPTLAVGVEFHNQTTTADHWRVGRLENAFDAFFAREDFRDYYKQEGFWAHVAYRPTSQNEIRIEYRNDIYSPEDQRVFYGRFGGNKRLPFNPLIEKSRYESYVLGYVGEYSHFEWEEGLNVFGDTIRLSTHAGTAYYVQAEFASRIGQLKENFSQYLVEVRHFQPIIAGLNLDSRLRFESSTGDVPLQKMQFVGGPSSLAALKNKLFGGNRMALLNTEIRINLALLTSYFDNNGTQLLIKNDFAMINSDSTYNPFSGLGAGGLNSILYNVGIGIGNSSGAEIGVSWRTDKKESPRLFVRFVRPF